MKAITVRQPWAWQIINQGKNIENRTRNIAGKYRGPLAIHAGLKPDMEALARLPAHAPLWVTAPRIFQYGVILGVVDLVDVHQSSSTPRADDGGCCEPWGEHLAGWHLALSNPRPLPKSIPCKGALGLWTPPDHIIEQLEQI